MSERDVLTCPQPDAAAGGDDDEPRCPQDAIEDSLLQARALIESTVARHRGATVGLPVMVVQRSAGGAVPDLVRTMVRQATRGVEVMLADDTSEVLLRSIGDLATAGTDDAVTIRVLCADPAVGRRLALADRPSVPGTQVRVVSAPMTPVVLVDGRAALVCPDPAGQRPVSVVRSESVVRAFQTLFTTLWRHSAAPLGRADFGGGARGRLVRQILQQLYAGVIDDVAARDLSVSVRTYRRYVAEIMETLGATSRFQAGVHAARNGLLAPRAPGAAGPAGRPQAAGRLVLAVPLRAAPAGNAGSVARRAGTAIGAATGTGGR